MIVEGIVLKGEGSIESEKVEAKGMLDLGPERWTEKIIRTKRYFITDTLDDFTGCKNRGEEIFIANTLAELIHEFVLRANGCWIGSSKWMLRALKNYDDKFADEFVNAFDVFYRTGQKSCVIFLSEKVLEPYGGRLFDGFSLGKDQ
jgi:hypothetical protein